MAREDDIHGFIGLRKVIGLSSVVGISLNAGQVASIVKYFSGGTCELGGISLLWGNGYVMGTAEAISVDSASTLYAVATGATVTLMVLKGRTSGFE